MKRLSLYICFIILSPFFLQAAPATLNCGALLASLDKGDEAELKKALSTALSNFDESDLIHMQRQVSDSNVIVPYPKVGSFIADQVSEVFDAIREAVLIGKLEAPSVRDLMLKVLGEKISETKKRAIKRKVVRNKRKKIKTNILKLSSPEGYATHVFINPLNLEGASFRTFRS